MLSYFIIVALFNFKIISGAENDNAFINSLPQKQKEEFLKKVEKRIQNEVAEVKFPKGNDSNVDLYEKRLEDQGKSIQNILRIEIDTLKRRNINDTIIKSDVRSSDNHESNSHIDLTMRRQKDEGNSAITQMESKRQPRKATLPGDENKNKDVKQVPVAVAYDNNISKEKRNLTNTSRVFNNSKVDEIRWETTSVATKVDNVNSSSINFNKAGRRSDNIDTMVKSVENKNPKKDNVKSAEAITYTSTDSTNAASYDINKSISQKNFNTKAVNVSTNTGRRSDNIDTVVKNVEDNKQTKYNVTSAKAVNDTSTDSVDAASYDINKFKSKKNVNTISVNVNASHIDVNKTSDIIDSNVKHLEDKKQKKYNAKSAEGVNDTSTDRIDAALYADSKSQYNFHAVSVNENTSSIDLNKTGRQSENIETNVQNVKNKTQKNDNVKSTEVVNDTLNDSIDAASYDINKSRSQKTVNTKAVIVNTSSIDVNKTERRSGITDKIVMKTQDNKLKDYNVKSAEAKNDTSTDSIDATSYDINVNTTRNAKDKNSKNNDKDSNQLESIHVMLSSVTTQNNVTSKPGNVSLPNNWVDRLGSNVQDSPDESATMANNVDHNTTSNDNEAAINKDPNKQTTDNKDNENQPQYVPVHKYDPENAYFNAYNYQGPSGNAGEELRNKTTNIEIDTYAKSTNIDFYSLLPSNTLRINDVKENESNTKIGVNSDLSDIIFRDSFSKLLSGKIKSTDIGSLESDIPYEKPLKHSLNKIRKILFKHKIGLDKLKDDRNNPDNKGKDDDNVLKKGFDTFEGKLEASVNRTDDYYTAFTENKKESDEDELNSDDKVYNDVIRSLKKHNKKIHNEDIHQIIIKLERIQNDMKKEKPNYKIVKPDNKNYQSRFQVKNRDERKPRPSSIEEDIKNGAFMIGDETYYENGNRNKSKNLNINDKYLKLHASILKDLVDRNDVGLEKYDWLGTTVKIQAAIAKLQFIIQKKRNRDKVHRLDHRLLELIIRLHKSAVEELIDRENAENEDPRKKRTISFRIPKPKTGKSFNRLERIFDIHRNSRKRMRTDIENFDWTMDCFKGCLNDLHTAIKQISLITTFKNQHWFQNLKQLYLKNASEKEYLEVLLHLVSAKLIGLLEKTAKTILEEDEDYLKKNRAMYEIIEMEFVTLIKICNELMRLNN